MIVQQLAAAFQELAASGTAVLLAEPSIGALHHRIDRGYVLIRGELVASDEGGGASLDHAYQRRGPHPRRRRRRRLVGRRRRPARARRGRPAPNAA